MLRADSSSGAARFLREVAAAPAQRADAEEADRACRARGPRAGRRSDGRRPRRLEPAPRRARLRRVADVAAGRRRDDGSTRPALPLRAERRRRAPQTAVSGRGAAARGQGVARLRPLARRGRRL